MEVQAITKNVRMSAQKMREVVRQIQGLPAAHAQAVLAVVPRKGARFVAKTLKSAIANAEDLKTHHKDYSELNTDRLVIKEALAQTASTLRRFTPKARGSAGPILKRNCHIKIVLTDE
ncbi:MAG TPA: 50S ribosomal protein L22 [Candidatus Binatia bacterium]|jgi:large subunit ribosomal protein L22|nr:50S ribosomal protein L22 [Candidatus Binatia bacterium]